MNSKKRVRIVEEEDGTMRQFKFSVGYLRAGVLVGALALTTAACSSGPSSGSSSGSGSSSTAAPVSVDMGYYGAGNATSVLPYVTQQEGFFSKNGINMQLTQIPSSAGQLAALAGGSIDIVAASPEAVLPLIEKGQPLELIGGQSTIIWELLVSNSVKTPGSYPTNLQALKGKTFGVTAIGSSGEYFAQGIMAQAGVPATSINWVGTGAPAPTVAALESGEIQATMSFQSTVYTATSSGKARVLLDLRDGVGLPSYIHCCDYVGLWATKSWASSHQAAIKAINKAQSQAYVWMTDKANFKKMETLANDNAGGQVTSADLSSYTTSIIKLADPAYSLATLKSWDLFDVKAKLISSEVSTASLINPAVPSSFSAARSLAG